MLTLTEAAQRLGVSPSMVGKYAAQGRIPGARRHGKAWAIPADAVLPEKRRPGPKAKAVSA